MVTTVIGMSGIGFTAIGTDIIVVGMNLEFLLTGRAVSVPHMCGGIGIHIVMSDRISLCGKQVDSLALERTDDKSGDSA